jgi:parallel beta-helix repeat protein/predicted outer membrane repeat protein
MYCYYSSSPTLTNCTFTDNTAAQRGGGMYCRYSSSPTLKNCTFTDNAGRDGGGMGCYESSSPTLTDCTFTNNYVSGSGGGIFSSFSSPTLENCSFTGNSSSLNGGGFYARETGSPIFENCTFTDNTAAQRGGGMYCRDFSSPTLESCTFANNTANYEGGGMWCRTSSSPTLENCTFANNTANYGGGMRCDAGSSPTLTNCTFTNNTATSRGGGMYCRDFSSPTLTNCILWDNHASSGSEIYDDATGVLTVTYSDIKGGWTGTGNIDADPLFVDPVNGDFHLQAGSPCIDTGDPNSPPDPDGTPADMGAFYFHGGAPTLSVTNLVAGQTALVEVTNATANNRSHFAWSLSGGGPTSTPWGDAMLDPGFLYVLLRTDANGYASYSANIPATAAGLTVWMHGTNVGTQSMLNALMMVIQ